MKLSKQNLPFTTVANEVLCNPSISWKAKGLYAYLFSKPDGWEFSSNRITREGLDGRHLVQATLRELENYGYLERTKKSNGKMDYFLKYSIQSLKTELRLIDEPKSENPIVQKVHSAETDPISNKENTSNKDIATASVAPFDWNKYMQTLFTSNQEHLNVIALYFREKGLKFENSKEASVAISRHCRAAKEVAVFGDDKIIKATKQAKEEYPKNFTIETILKVLTR